MKILLCHNYYQQRGGEDESFEEEVRLLETHGHAVVRFTVHNDRIKEMSRGKLALCSLWNRRTWAELREVIRHERPAVMHCTNTFPLMSAAAYDAAHGESVPVVQALHNYRLVCPSATLLRDGQVCESCLGKPLAWPGVWHGCYRESRVATAVVAALSALQRGRQRWKPAVDFYYAPTDFARQKLIEGGLPADRIAVKPNFVYSDPGPGAGQGNYVIFVGRLSPEKGIATLLAAWSQFSAQGCTLRLRIVGDGPLAGQVKAAAAANPNIEWLGRRSLNETLSLIGEASCLVMPSIWYETFGRTIIEAFAKGTPVVVSNLGAMAELVAEGQTGLHFQPGDSADLARQVVRLLSDAGMLASLRTAARREYERKYTAELNYDMLMAIYARAIAFHQRSSATSTVANFPQGGTSPPVVSTAGDQPLAS